MASAKITGAVLVVGGGIGGIQASLNLAEAGYKVYLVEKSPAIGGVMAQLDKTFPTNDCAMCILSPKLVECGRHLNIEVLTCAEVQDIAGAAGNFQVSVKKHPRYVELPKCTGCGDCAQACPVQLPSEFDQGVGLRKAIYRPFAQAFPGAFAISKRGKPPCRLACPAGVNVQGYIALLRQGKHNESLALIKESLPLPGVLGRICTHPCEARCNRAEFDEPVSICALKRFIADRAEDTTPAIAETRPEKVAIVGSGPAGLAAAYFLAREGYQSTIFEALPVVGGMLRVGIPEYRLPRDVLEKEIEGIRKLGVEIRTGITIGRDLTVADLLETGFKAVFLASGAHNNRRLGIPGEDAEGVVPGVAFLRRMNLGEAQQVGEKVAVVGGGNVAIDAARSALRLGAKKVMILYRRTRAEMPAAEEEVEAAEAEGVKMEYLAAPVTVLVDGGKVRGVRCVRMMLGEPDASGRRLPVPLPGSEFDIAADMVIPAIGQSPDLTFATPDSRMELDPAGNLIIDPASLATTRPGIFAGGDLQSGPATAVEAIAAGKKAALSIIEYLRGSGISRVSEKPDEKPVTAAQVIKPEVREPRYKIPTLPLEKRSAGFQEVNAGFSEQTALQEADRCLDCGICSECMQCLAACKANAINHAMREEIVKLNVGSVILSGGFDKYQPGVLREYGYGIYPDVVTSAEFERILSASGPYQGQLQRPSDKRMPKKIAWLQCVGSRDINRGNEYCSSVCCTYAIKEAIIAREHAGFALDTATFFMDIRTFGKGFDAYAERARQEHQVRFVRSKVYSVTELEGTTDLLVRYMSEDGKLTREPFDMVVLSVGFVPPRDAVELARQAGISLNKYGFCQSGEFSPTETSRPGIFVSGGFQSPKDIPETVVQASAAAAGAAALLAPARNTEVADKQYPPEQDIAGEPARIGVFVCHCGLNIASVVSIPEVMDYVRGLPGVVFADNNLYTCSQDTQRRIKEKMDEFRLNRVVVASCSPRTHEPLFQETIREAGLNRFLFEMANIRDQCSWVHMHEPEKATRKAKELVRMAVARAARLEPLHKVGLGLVHEALVVGGGVAGMTAALNLARQSFRTYLVERGKELGGWANKIYFTSEGQDIQPFVRGLITEVESNCLIEVITEANLQKTEGFIGNFKTTLSLADGKKQRLVEHGVTVVATGATEYRGAVPLLGEDKRVLTLADFEEKLAREPEKMTRLKEAVIELCVRPPGISYCSRVCCTAAIKNALQLREINPGANIYILYKDIRTYGFKEALYTAAREAGIIFIRYTDERPPQAKLAAGEIKVDVFELVLAEQLTLSPDLLVLAVPMVPAAGNVELSRILKVPLTEEGFFHEAHVKLAPVDFASEGIFMCGTAHAPKFIDESITQGLAAAARAGTILAKKQLEVGGVISRVDADKCTACLTCVRVCPYDVPYINSDGAAEIDVARCRGCGICAAECPRLAIKLLNYQEDQVTAKTDALLALGG